MIIGDHAGRGDRRINVNWLGQIGPAIVAHVFSSCWLQCGCTFMPRLKIENTPSTEIGVDIATIDISSRYDELALMLLRVPKPPFGYDRTQRRASVNQRYHVTANVTLPGLGKGAAA